MRTIKSVTIGNTKNNESRFITRGGTPIALADDKIAPEKETASSKGRSAVGGVLGNRSSAQSTNADHKDTLIPESVGGALNQLHNEIQNQYAEAETAADGGGNFSGAGGLPAGTNVTDVVVRNMLINVIDDVVTDNDPFRTNKVLNRVFRDMFQHDSTTGSAIGMMSTIPFSDFSILGLKDEKMTDIFVDSVESMAIGSLLPKLSVDYMTVGSALLSLAFNEELKRFSGVTPHDIDFATFTQIPVFNIDPEIKITLPPQYQKFFANEELIKKYKDYIPKQLLDQVKAGASKNTEFTLDSKTTIFIARGQNMSDYRGTSVLKRALPAWFYEKALIKGTLDQVYKRQRATMHITMGDGDEWVPTAEEMAAISNLFLSADLDPLGAVVVTRNGVSPNEIRRGDDFWRWDSNYDELEKIKLRAMGVSDTFITGDATYNNMEQALSVFMDQIRTYRNQVTRELFYEKMFPMISHANNITKQRYSIRKAKELSSYGSTRVYRDEDHNLVAVIGSNYPIVKELAAGTVEDRIDVTKYLIPEVQWHKKLLPEADNDYIQMLTTLDTAGVPITVRALAAAGGQKLDKLMEDFQADLDARKKIAEWRKAIQDINQAAGIIDPNNPNAGQDTDGMGGYGPGSGDADGGDDDNADFASAFYNYGAGNFGTRPRSLLSRGNPDHPNAQFFAENGRGQRFRPSPKGRQVLAERFTKKLAAAASEVAKQENARTKAEIAAREPKKRLYYLKKQR